jgi:hypothetical protein
MLVERLKEILIHNAFYSVEEFLNYCQKILTVPCLYIFSDKSSITLCKY